MEDVSILRFILAFAFVLGLIGMFGFGLKKWGNKVPGLMGTLPGQGGRRLKIIETCIVGAKYRLVLVKRDAKEHLLLVGQENAKVVEKGIIHEDAEA